jgi:hypothetical protein
VAFVGLFDVSVDRKGSDVIDCWCTILDIVHTEPSYLEYVTLTCVAEDNDSRRFSSQPYRLAYFSGCSLMLRAVTHPFRLGPPCSMQVMGRKCSARWYASM